MPTRTIKLRLNRCSFRTTVVNGKHRSIMLEILPLILYTDTDAHMLSIKTCYSLTISFILVGYRFKTHVGRAAVFLKFIGLRKIKSGFHPHFLYFKCHQVQKLVWCWLCAWSINHSRSIMLEIPHLLAVLTLHQSQGAILLPLVWSIVLKHMLEELLCF